MILLKEKKKTEDFKNLSRAEKKIVLSIKKLCHEIWFSWKQYIKLARTAKQLLKPSQESLPKYAELSSRAWSILPFLNMVFIFTVLC